MISYEEAYKAVISRARVLSAEAVPLGEARGRVLAEDILIDMDMPPFDKSAMDGYACRKEDLPGPLRVVEVIQAGVAPQKDIGPGECAKIMTGAKIPNGADWVVMVEHCTTDEEDRVLIIGPAEEANICIQGEDLRCGDKLLDRGLLLESRHIALLATAGYAAPKVIRRPRVGLIATGSELVEPEHKPGTCQIRNSNSWQICAQMEETGAKVRYYGIVGDVEDDLDRIMKHALVENDVVLFSGGVSMGDYDFVPGVMARNGLTLIFDAVAMRPGKPTTFGVGADAFCFGLPGNPVSTFLQCEILVKPFLHALMGHVFKAPWRWCVLSDAYTRKRTGRAAWVPVLRVDEDTVKPAPYHGSAHISALSSSFGFMVIPPQVAGVEKGARTKIWVL